MNERPTQRPSLDHVRLASTLALVSLAASSLAPSAAQQASVAPAPFGPTVNHTCRVEAIPVERPASLSQQRAAPFQFAVTWDPSVPASHVPVIQHAIDEWEAMIDDDGLSVNPFPITVLYTDLGGLLGLTTTYYIATGGVTSATVRFHDGVLWFVDPTPWAAEEFDANGFGGPTGHDLLTVARHELAHAVGYIDAPSLPYVTPSAGGAGTTFDAPRCNFPWTGAGGGHTDPAFFPNDLMAPGVGPSTRRWINAYFHGAHLSRVHRYTVNADFVDLFHNGNSNGGTFLPWDNFASGYFLSPSNGEVWVRPATYLEAPLTLNVPKKIQALRGGVVTIN